MTGRRVVLIVVLGFVIGCGAPKTEAKTAQPHDDAPPADATLPESAGIEIVFISDAWVASINRDKKTDEIAQAIMERLTPEKALADATDAAVAATLGDAAARDPQRPKAFATSMARMESGGPYEVLAGARTAKPGDVFKATRPSRRSGSDPSGVFVARRPFVSSR